MVKSSGLDVKATGAPIKDMRMTRSDDLIIEMSDGGKATSAADTLRKQLADKLGALTGPVSRLSSLEDFEVIGIDATADREEVLELVKAAVTGDDEIVAAEKAEITLTNLWAVRSGHQIVTLRVPASVASRIQSVHNGWMKCAMRPRRRDPDRCYNATVLDIPAETVRDLT